MMDQETTGRLIKSQIIIQTKIGLPIVFSQIQMLITEALNILLSVSLIKAHEGCGLQHPTSINLRFTFTLPKPKKSKVSLPNTLDTANTHLPSQQNSPFRNHITTNHPGQV